MTQQNSVFISYSRRNKVFVQKLDAALRQATYDPWVDWEDIPPSVDWMEKIQRGIEAANNIIFVISPDSIQSKVCFAEIAHATDHNKRLIPIVHQDVQLGNSPKRESNQRENPLDRAYAKLGFEPESDILMQRLGQYNWIFFRETDDFEKAIRQLVEALQLDEHYVETHTRTHIRAREWQEKDRDTGLLLRGSDLSEALQWLEKAENHNPAPTPLHAEFITASKKANTNRRRIQQFTIAYSLAIAALLIAALFLFNRANTQRNLAEKAQAQAERSANQVENLALTTNSLIALSEENNELSIFLALQALERDDSLLEAQRILAEAAYSPGTILALEDDGAGIFDFDLSADGSTLLATTTKGKAIFWDLETRTITKTFSPPDEIGFLYSVDISPDSHLAAAGDSDGNIIIWDIQSDEIRYSIGEHINTVTSVMFSPDGKKLLSTSYDGLGIIWDVETGALIHILTGHHAGISAGAFSPDGKLAVTGDEDSEIIVWDVETGEALNKLTGHTDIVTDVAFSPDGTLIASSSFDFSVRIWSVGNGQQIFNLKQHLNLAMGVAFSPNGEYLVSVAEDNTAILWSMETGEMIHRFKGHTQGITHAYFAADNITFFTSGMDGTLREWDIIDRSSYRTLTNHKDTVTAVDYSPDGQHLFTVSADGKIILWDARTIEPLSIIQTDYSITAARFDSTGSMILTANEDGFLDEWDIMGKELILPFDEQVGHIRSVDISPDGNYALSGGDNADLVLWEMETGTIIRRFDTDDEGLNCVTFLADGLHAITAGYENLTLWDLQTGEVVRTYDNHTNAILTFDISPDGQTMVSGGLDTLLIFWNIETGEELHRIGNINSVIQVVKFSPDGKTLLAGLEDRTIRVFDVATGQEVRRYKGHTDWVSSAAFSPDGKTILSGSWDTTVHLWRVDSQDELVAWICENRYVIPLNKVNTMGLPIELKDNLCPAT